MFSLLGCPHNHLSFPMVTQEAAGNAAESGQQHSGPATQAHVTCLDCGREFWYDWARMRRLAERPQPVYFRRDPPRRAA
ncbi:MAG: hypothetical protein ACRD1E_12665 [Terriglobales bacterium]